MMGTLTKAEYERLLGSLKGMSAKDMLDTLALLDEIDKRKRLAMAQQDFLAFIAAVDPQYKFGTHLKRLGGLLMQIESGEKDRIAVSMPPRFGKSQMISIYYPAWYLGKHPDHKLIVASHTADLAVDLARKVRNLMQSDLYQEIFPNVRISADAKAAGKWNTTKGGEVFAAGVGGALAGRGAHLAVVDDPLSEQDLKVGNTSSLDVVYEWFRAGLRTRLMPEGKIAILHTRWHQRDLIGRLTKDAILNPEADQYEIFEFPAILESPNPLADPDSSEYNPEAPSVLQKSLWPEQWSLESLLRTKASMPAWQWNAQYQQTPTAQEAAIIKRDHIRWWTKESPPAVDYTVQAWDTALTTKERSDYSVCQTWGVWKDEDGIDSVILLNRVKGKYEFPELKRTALQQVKDWTPDTVIIETKASGQPLVDEMRRSGIYVQEFSPGKGQDKIARVNAISDMFTSGQVWFPETWWASEVVDELLAFPAGEHDDDVDACTLALIRIRKGGLLRLNSDNVEDDDYIPRRGGYY
jgi:predicted phage terminase large subunit-like protein